MNIRKFKWILAFAGAVAVVLLLRGFAFTSCLIPSTGMENSIFQGERILVNKWSYGLRIPFMFAFLLSPLVRESCASARHRSIQ